MTPDPGIANEAARLVKDDPRPVFWPDLTPGETKREWEQLRRWVEKLCARYPNSIRLPECWWRHNDLVEVLAALRDCERACFAATGSATGPIEWQRALRDMEIRIEIWVKRLTCNVPGRGHDPVHDERADVRPAGWDEFLDDDVQRRIAANASSPSHATRASRIGR